MVIGREQPKPSYHYTIVSEGYLGAQGGTEMLMMQDFFQNFNDSQEGGFLHLNNFQNICHSDEQFMCILLYSSGAFNTTGGKCPVEDDPLCLSFYVISNPSRT